MPHSAYGWGGALSNTALLLCVLSVSCPLFRMVHLRAMVRTLIGNPCWKSWWRKWQQIYRSTHQAAPPVRLLPFSIVDSANWDVGQLLYWLQTAAFARYESLSSVAAYRLNLHAGRTLFLRGRQALGPCVPMVCLPFMSVYKYFMINLLIELIYDGLLNHCRWLICQFLL